MTTKQEIDEFLAQKRLALVGISRMPKDFSRAVLRSLVERGYDVIPVNPNLPEVEGRPCFARLQEISPPPDGAILFTRPVVTDEVVRDCAEAGVHRVWMHRGAGTGAVSREAVEFCRSRNMTVIEGECPYMFLNGSGFPHGFHGFIRKILGKYPA